MNSRSSNKTNDHANNTRVIESLQQVGSALANDVVYPEARNLVNRAASPDFDDFDDFYDVGIADSDRVTSSGQTSSDPRKRLGRRSRRVVAVAGVAVLVATSVGGTAKLAAFRRNRHTAAVVRTVMQATDDANRTHLGLLSPRYHAVASSTTYDHHDGDPFDQAPDHYLEVTASSGPITTVRWMVGQWSGPVASGEHNRTVRVGSAEGVIETQSVAIPGKPDQAHWSIRWAPAGADGAFYAYGAGEAPAPEVLKLFATISNDGQHLRFDAPPKGLSVTERSYPVVYGLQYRTSGADDNQVFITVSVGDADSADAVLQPGQRAVTRGSRNFRVQGGADGQSPALPGQPPGLVIVSWDYRPGVNAMLQLQKKSDESSAQAEERAVDLAAQVGPVDARQWATLFPDAPPTIAVESDDPAVPWILRVYRKTPGAACPGVQFEHAQQAKELCVTGGGTVRGIDVAQAGDAPVVFGIVTDASPDNDVVRIVDANGDVVGEDVASDQSEFPGRVFAVQLSPGAKAPFTVELHTFDRAWYVDQDPQESYVREGSQPFASTELVEK